MTVAQQLIDASEDGGLAFLVFAIMVFLFTASLFYMDRIRRRRLRRSTSSAIQCIEAAASAAASIVCSMSASVCARLGKSVS